MRLVILGAGAWGTALALSLASRHEVVLWDHDPAQVERLYRDRENARYLPGFPLADTIRVESALPAALANADLALIVTPVAGLRPCFRAIAAAGRPMPVVWACKGFEAGGAHLPHQVAAEEYRDIAPTGVLSGPSFALEVAQAMPTAVTLASADESFARGVAAQIHSPRLRVYSSTDVIGVEVGGAVKNVMAIAAGISDGIGFGHNARAALLTRGLAEMTRLGVRLGGRQETFLGLSGAGDLILTCTGDLSRNRRVGLMLAQGKALPQILAELGHVAEGVHTAREVQRLADQHGVEMPITRAVCAVLHEGVPAPAAVEALLKREPKEEIYR